VAIAFARLIIIRADQSAVGTAAYIARRDWRCDRLRTRHRHARKRKDLVSLAVLLPAGASPEMANPKKLWNAAEAAEMVYDRKKKLQRLRVGAQLAKHFMLALPRELSDNKREALAHDFVREHFTRHGVAAMVAIHRPDRPETGNWHCHILVTTRALDGDGFGDKARHLNPDFSRREGETWSRLHPDHLPEQWRDYQNAWFRRRRIPLKVDPRRAEPGRHLGRKRHQDKEGAKAEIQEGQNRANRRIRHIEKLLTEVMRGRNTFTRQDLLRLLDHHGIVGDEAMKLANNALDLPGTVRLFAQDSLRPTGRYTRNTIWFQEEKILGDAAFLAKRKSTGTALDAVQRRLQAVPSGANRALTPEEFEVAVQAVAGPRLMLIRAASDAGKLATIEAIRQDFLKRNGQKKESYRVICLAPNGAAVRKLADAGIKGARTLSAEIAIQDRGPADEHAWTSKTCVLVDSADIVDARLMAKLLAYVRRTKARLVLIGGNAGESGTTRHGMFRLLEGRFESSDLGGKASRSLPWMTDVVNDFTHGRIATAIQNLTANGRLHMEANDEATIDRLVRNWANDIQSGRVEDRFVFATTEDVINALNAQLQAVRWKGQHPKSVKMPTADSTVSLCQNDRVQFHADDPASGVQDGLVATAVGFNKGILTAQTDDGRRLKVDLRKYRNWGLGYAGRTCRRQATLLQKGYLVYDHRDLWDASTCAEAMAMSDDVELHMPETVAADRGALARQITAASDVVAHTWLCFEEMEQARAEREAAARKFQINVSLFWKSWTLDLRHERDRRILRRAIPLMPMHQFIDVYRRLDNISKTARETPDIRELADRQILIMNGLAGTRGFSPATGKPNPDCIKLNTLGMDISPNPHGLLEPDQGEIDVRRLINDPLHIIPSDFREMQIRISRFDHPVLVAIQSRFLKLKGTIDVKDPVYPLLHYAHILIKRIAAGKSRDANGKRRTEADKIRALEQVGDEDALPRATRLFDKHVRIAAESIEEAGPSLTLLSKSAALAVVANPARPPQESLADKLKRLNARLRDLRAREENVTGLEAFETHVDIAGLMHAIDLLRRKVDDDILKKYQPSRGRSQLEPASATPPAPAEPEASSPTAKQRPIGQPQRTGGGSGGDVR